MCINNEVRNFNLCMSYVLVSVKINAHACCSVMLMVTSNIQQEKFLFLVLWLSLSLSKLITIIHLDHAVISATHDTLN